MFLIKRVTDPRLAARICDSFGAPENGSFAYAATKGDEVLGTAVFFTAPGGCVTLAGADTGRRLDVGLVDGMARAAFTAQMRAGALSAKLGEGLSEELRLALTKLGYEAQMCIRDSFLSVQEMGPPAGAGPGNSAAPRAANLSPLSVDYRQAPPLTER